jgi:hypothetical protein
MDKKGNNVQKMAQKINYFSVSKTCTCTTPLILLSSLHGKGLARRLKYI